MLNQVQVIGHLGRDPEVRYAPSGDAIASFSVAATEKWKSKAGDQQEHTEWFRCVAHGRLGEVCGEYLKKGTQVYVQGKLRTRKWQDKDGADRQSTEMIVSTMQMLGGKSSGATGGDAPQAPAIRLQQQPRQPQRPADDLVDDEIPF